MRTTSAIKDMSRQGARSSEGYRFRILLKISSGQNRIMVQLYYSFLSFWAVSLVYQVKCCLPNWALNFQSLFKKHNVVANKGTIPVASVTKLAKSGKKCPKRLTHFAPTYFQMHPPFYCAKCKFPLLDCVTYPWKYNNEVGEWGVYFRFLSITCFKISMNLETIKFLSSAVWKSAQWHWIDYSLACCL